tara:strand:+ start:1144 stop:1656 length:513 start_codon:yes stop_codon:yes gene_type:complete
MDKRKLDIEKLYIYGEKSENILYDIIKQYRNDVVITDRYNSFDFIIETDERIILIELKTRTYIKNKFNTTYFPVNKVRTYNKFKRDNKYKNKKICLLICFGFPNKNIDINEITDDELKLINFSYYIIQYNPGVFNNYILTDNIYDADKNINIVIEDLKNAEYFFDIISKY